MDHSPSDQFAIVGSGDPLDPLVSGRLAFAGVAYPFTPIPKEQLGPFMRTWYNGDDAARMAALLEILSAALGPEVAAVVQRRAEDAGDPLDLDMVIHGAGLAMGASCKAAAAAMRPGEPG